MADVAATLAQWSSTTGSNSPSGATNIGSGLDDNLREIQGVITRGLSHKGVDIASATTTDIGAVEGLMHDITGTTTITGLGTVRAGIWKVLKFEGALTLTHNATSLILPGGANITTADGDIAIVISEGAGNWRCAAYQKASGLPVVDTSPSGSITSSGYTMATARLLGRTTASTGAIEEISVGTGLTFSAGSLSLTTAAPSAASQSDQETATSTTTYVSPGRQQYHPSAAKGWVYALSDGTGNASYNVSSITDSATGVAQINWSTLFSSANYAPQVSVFAVSTQLTCRVSVVSAAATTVRSYSIGGTDLDPAAYFVSAHGDQ